MKLLRIRECLLRSLGGGACLFVLALGVAAQRVRQVPRAPNVLVIVLDDVGTDQLQFYGETPSPTSGMARQGGGKGGERLTRTPVHGSGGGSGDES